MPTPRPPELDSLPPSRPWPGGAPPSPPIFWRGGGGGGPRWPRWKLLLLCLLDVATVLASAFVIGRGMREYPAPVLAGLAVLALYWVRARPLQRSHVTSTVPTVPLALIWAGFAGSIAFLLSHLWPPHASWPFLLAGAVGIGGAAGLLAWLFGNLLVLGAIAAWWLAKELRQPRWFAKPPPPPFTCPFCGTQGVQRSSPNTPYLLWDSECSAIGLGGLRLNPDSLAIHLLVFLGIPFQVEPFSLSAPPAYMGPHVSETMEELLGTHSFQWQWSDWLEGEEPMYSIWVRRKAP